VIFLLLPNNTHQWRFRVQQRTIKDPANNSSHCTLAARSLPSQQYQAPERACITFSQISNHIYDMLIKMLEFFSSRFIHYNLDMRPLQSNHNTFCDIHIFSASTTTPEALHFSIQKLAIVECSSHMQVKFCVVFIVQRKFCEAFSCENKIFLVFLWYNVCNNFFFAVQLVQRKYLWRFYVLKRNSAVRFSQIETKLSYLAIGKAQLNACAFSDGVEKQKCCLGPGDIKTVITFLLHTFLIPNLAGCFLTAIATVSVIFTFFPLLE